MIRDLYVGDLHVQVSNLTETRKLLAFIRQQFIENQCRNLILLGDIFHTHSVVRQEVAYLVLEFLKDFFFNVVKAHRNRIIILVGNHDGISPTITEQNAVDLILGEFATIVSGDMHLVGDDGFVFMPFVYDHNKFLEIQSMAYQASTQRGHKDPILVCHQTFDGAAYESGMLCPDGIKSEALRFSVIISGHIHKRQIVKDKVLYLGTPRAVTAGEVNDEKFIFTVGRTEEGRVSLVPISTKDIVKHYYLTEVTEGVNDSLDLSQYDLGKDDIRVRVTGSQVFYDTMKAKYKSLKGQVKFIPNIKKDLSKRINLEATNISIELALEGYVKEIADIDPTIKEDVWQTIAKML